MKLFNKDKITKRKGAEQSDQQIHYTTGSGITEKKDRRHHIIASASGLAALFIVVGALFLNKEAIVKYGNEYLAAFDTAEEISELEANGYAFAFGTEPSDQRDFTEFSIPEPSQELEDEFYKALQTSPAFEEIDNVNELIDYDQFDKDGNISEQAMRDIIGIAEASQ